MLAFVLCALAGLCAPTGCVMGPSGALPNRHSLEHFFCSRCCRDHSSEPSCGAPYACDCPACDCAPSAMEIDAHTCPPHCHKKQPWHHLSKFKMYDPEAGIFNFCVPPACIHPPPPLPPGRFFPVPVRPAFAPQLYSMLGYGANGPPGPPGAPVPCN